MKAADLRVGDLVLVPWLSKDIDSLGLFVQIYKEGQVLECGELGDYAGSLVCCYVDDGTECAHYYLIKEVRSFKG